eukprot:TRINITY_DN1253_c0_g1_i2.p2 TRINITY_DN1253_c0_g1~~TRINITY_DN1253_c0_g1_i2.p2  ORF type:complete len:212 (+),score=49.14 TRINITY_DN1253_c0_g1_i2:1030-1665(+)
MRSVWGDVPVVRRQSVPGLARGRTAGLRWDAPSSLAGLKVPRARPEPEPEPEPAARQPAEDPPALPYALDSPPVASPPSVAQAQAPAEAGSDTDDGLGPAVTPAQPALAPAGEFSDTDGGTEPGVKLDVWGASKPQKPAAPRAQRHSSPADQSLPTPFASTLRTTGLPAQSPSTVALLGAISCCGDSQDTTSIQNTPPIRAVLAPRDRALE